MRSDLLPTPDSQPTTHTSLLHLGIPALKSALYWSPSPVRSPIPSLSSPPVLVPPFCGFSFHLQSTSLIAHCSLITTAFSPVSLPPISPSLQSTLDNGTQLIFQPTVQNNYFPKATQLISKTQI